MLEIRLSAVRFFPLSKLHLKTNSKQNIQFFSIPFRIRCCCCCCFRISHHQISSLSECLNLKNEKKNKTRFICCFHRHSPRKNVFFINFLSQLECRYSSKIFCAFIFFEILFFSSSSSSIQSSLNVRTDTKQKMMNRRRYFIYVF